MTSTTLLTYTVRLAIGGAVLLAVLVLAACGGIGQPLLSDVQADLPRCADGSG
ncbi:MAG: hypothetical protein HC893_09045 [Chloroflexaceae bacterium]|nr:hypothetical protein [Chloroflexaceae bacterium]